MDVEPGAAHPGPGDDPCPGRGRHLRHQGEPRGGSPAAGSGRAGGAGGCPGSATDRRTGRGRADGFRRAGRADQPRADPRRPA